MSLINPTRDITFLNATYSERSVGKMPDRELLTLRNLLADNLEGKRRRKITNRDKIVGETWKLLCIYDGDDIAMPEEEKKVERPTPKCYSAETVKRPTRKMFMRIKKVGEPDKSQRPFAWGQFKDGMRLIDIKEDPNLHAGKISFWGRQKPPLIQMVDIDDATYQKELDAWYKKHGLTNPEAEKRQKAEAKEKAKAEREKAKAEAAKKREADKAAKEKAKAEAAKKREADKAAKAKAKEEAEKKRAAEKKAKADEAAKKKAATAAAKPAPAAGKSAPAAGKPAPAAGKPA